MDETLIPEDDGELAVFLAQVVELADSSLETEQFLHRISALEEQFEALRKFRKPKLLKDRLTAFARSRLQPDALAPGGKEVLVLSMVLVRYPKLVSQALKESAITLSGNLAEPEAVEVFGKLLKRTRAVARAAGDEDLLAWVDGVVAQLPE